MTDSSPGRRGSTPDRSRCGGEAWPCPRYDPPGQTEASGNWRQTHSVRTLHHGMWSFTPPDRKLDLLGFDLPELSGRHVVACEQAVPGVPQVFTELLIQLLQNTQTHCSYENHSL